jgi:cytochrome c553
VACNACHNSNNPQFPRLKGQHAEYMAQELFAFKRNARRNDDPSIMRYLAERLSDKEIRQLSEYLATGGQAQ